MRYFSFFHPTMSFYCFSFLKVAIRCYILECYIFRKRAKCPISRSHKFQQRSGSRMDTEEEAAEEEEESDSDNLELRVDISDWYKTGAGAAADASTSPALNDEDDDIDEYTEADK